MNSSLRSDKDFPTPTTTSTSLSFIQNIGLIHGTLAKDLFKEAMNTIHKLAEAASKRRFLLRCRSNDLFPSHIVNTCKHHNNVVFSSQYCKKRFSVLRENSKF